MYRTVTLQKSIGFTSAGRDGSVGIEVAYSFHAMTSSAIMSSISDPNTCGGAFLKALAEHEAAKLPDARPERMMKGCIGRIFQIENAIGCR